MRVHIKVQVSPTEDADRVMQAVLNIFPDALLEVKEDCIAGTTESLEYLKELLKKERIRDTMRETLTQQSGDGVLEFTLNKQAAYMGRVSLGASSPLGDISVRVECEDADALIQYLTEVEL